ncbi:hypothetical protein [Caloramator sp. ALD01]|uniref:hypothetical protein n=1 Tax=Caloramator sp. ALD01 TaxID=1031288 RepID=UPI000423DCBC|nr:hypothetical protein [Caloramator sp. ALD01]
MLKLVIATMLGGIIGFSMAALVVAIPKDEDELKTEWIEYKCKINQASGCSDYCCRECEKFNECSFKCEGNPEKCGQAYIKLR